MVSKKKLATAAVATFGVAMTSMYVVPELQADILDLTWNGGAASATNPFVPGTAGTPGAAIIDQVDTVGAAWLQWNDQYAGGSGRTAVFYTSAGPGPMSMELVNAGDVIDPATFVGRMSTSALGGMAPAVIGGGTELDGTGSAFVAVRPRTDPTTLFWFKMDFAPGQPITYSGGQVGTMGEALTVEGGSDCAFELGDTNNDGAVDLLDVAPFVAHITGGTFACEADIDGDGTVGLLDVAPFVDILTGG